MGVEIVRCRRVINTYCNLCTFIFSNIFVSRFQREALKFTRAENIMIVYTMGNLIVRRSIVINAHRHRNFKIVMLSINIEYWLASLRSQLDVWFEEPKIRSKFAEMHKQRRVGEIQQLVR